MSAPAMLSRCSETAGDAVRHRDRWGSDLARLPAAPLLDLVDAEQRRGVPLTQLLGSEALASAIRDARRRQGVTVRMAARLCGRLGLDPREVFGPAWDTPTPAGQCCVEPRLPAGPLVQAVEARLERLAATLTPLTDPGVARGMAITEVFGDHDALQRAYYRARQHGTLTLRAAEQFCDHFGWHPRMLWGDAYDAAALAGYDDDDDPWAGVA